MAAVRLRPNRIFTRLMFLLVRAWALFVGLSLSSPLRAQTVSDVKQKDVSVFSGTNPTSGIEEVAFSLAIVLALIFLLAWLLKRFAPGVGRMGNKHMQVLSSLSLGGKERLILVDVAGTQMVLGVSSDGVSCLHVFSAPVVCMDERRVTNAQDFGKILQSFVGSKDKS